MNLKEMENKDLVNKHFMFDGTPNKLNLLEKEIIFRMEIGDTTRNYNDAFSEENKKL